MSDSLTPHSAPVAQAPQAGPVSPVRAAAGVITAAMAQGHDSPAELAAAEQDAGLLFDPELAAELTRAAREQAAAEYRAEIRQQADQIESLQERLASVGWFKSKLDAVMGLCAGRPDWYAMTVREILTAAGAGPGKNTSAMGAAFTQAADAGPLHLVWEPQCVEFPDSPASTAGTAHVMCRTGRGAAATLVLTAGQRRALTSLLGSEWRIDHEACRTPGCGILADEADENDPALWGWNLLQVAGTSRPAAWYCNPWCAESARAAAADELAAADRAGEPDGGL